jgi:hypothetical protein
MPPHSGLQSWRPFIFLPQRDFFDVLVQPTQELFPLGFADGFLLRACTPGPNHNLADRNSLVQGLEEYTRIVWYGMV